MRAPWSFLLFALVLLVASCGGDAPASPAPGHSPSALPISDSDTPLPTPTRTPTLKGETPRRGGVLILASRGDPPAGFDSMRTTSIALHHVGGSLFGSGNLVRRCQDNMYLVCPELARQWVAGPGFTEWTFTIRPDVIWHDGTTFTAQDAKFWFDLAYQGATAGSKTRAPANFRGEWGEIASTEVLSKNRLRVTLKQRNALFLDTLANPRTKLAHPRHLMEPRIAQGEMNVTPLDVGLVGAGPFSFAKYETGSLVRVRRFARYWDRSRQGTPLPFLDGIDFVIMPDAFTMDAAFRAGRLDGGARGEGHYLTTPRKDGYVRDLGDRVFFAELEGGMYRLAFNVLKTGPWQDARVRRAIALWIDKQAAVDAAMGGLGWTSPSLGPENPYKNKKFLNWPKFDLDPLSVRRAEAKGLMAEAGYAGGFTMTHLCRALLPVRCEVLKDQLAGLGINLQLSLLDEGAWNRERTTLNFDTQQGALTPPIVPEGTEAAYGRYSRNPDAYSKHEDAAVDDLYRRLRNALTLPARVDLWRQIERYMFLDQTYIVPIAETINVIPYRTYVKGLAIPPEDGHSHTDFAAVWLDSRAR